MAPVLSHTSPMVKALGLISRTAEASSRSTGKVPGACFIWVPASTKWATASRRKPSTPISRSQNRAASRVKARTCGLAKFRSGMPLQKTAKYCSSLDGERYHTSWPHGPFTPGLVGVHRNQSRQGEAGSAAACLNQGCSLEVWFSTRSTSTRMPRRCASAIRRLKSSAVP